MVKCMFTATMPLNLHSRLWYITSLAALQHLKYLLATPMVRRFTMQPRVTKVMVINLTPISIAHSKDMLE